MLFSADAGHETIFMPQIVSKRMTNGDKKYSKKNYSQIDDIPKLFLIYGTCNNIKTMYVCICAHLSKLKRF